MKAWLFDVDGVITNPELKKANPEIISILVKILERGEIVGLNTGRSLDFIVKEVLTSLENNLEDRNLLSKVYFVGEKGGAWGKYKNGQIESIIDPKIRISSTLIERVRDLVESGYSKTTFFDDTKKTMISTEFKKGADLNEYHRDQVKIVESFKIILNELGVNELNIELSIISTDIQFPFVGKDLGVERFLDMLGKIKPNEFETFGDSPSDIEMYKDIIRRKFKAKFVYVGRKEIENGVNIIKTNKKFDEGVLEYFQSSLSER